MEHIKTVLFNVTSRDVKTTTANHESEEYQNFLRDGYVAIGEMNTSSSISILGDKFDEFNKVIATEEEDFEWKKDLETISCDFMDDDDYRVDGDYKKDLLPKYQKIFEDLQSGEIVKARINGTDTDDHILCVTVDIAYLNGNQYRVEFMWVGWEGVRDASIASDGYSFAPLNKMISERVFINNDAI